MSDQRPVISVIVPAYNEENNISGCLQSLKNQKFRYPFEIIVVNGPSKDKTAEICKKNGVKVIDLDKRGINLAWQKGAEEASADILAFTEADCTVTDNWLERIYDEFQENAKVVGVSGEYRVKGRKIINKILPLSMPLLDEIYKFWTGYWPFRGTNFAVRKKYLLECGGFNLDMLMYGDVELSSRIGKLGEIRYLKNFIVYTTDRNYCSFGKELKFHLRGLKAVLIIGVLRKPKKMNYLHS